MAKFVLVAKANNTPVMENIWFFMVGLGLNCLVFFSLDRYMNQVINMLNVLT